MVGEDMTDSSLFGISFSPRGWLAGLSIVFPCTIVYRHGFCIAFAGLILYQHIITVLPIQGLQLLPLVMHIGSSRPITAPDHQTLHLDHATKDVSYFRENTSTTSGTGSLKV